MNARNKRLKRITVGLLMALVMVLGMLPMSSFTAFAADEATCTCGTDDDSIHATTCAVYVAPETAVCYCTEKCSDTNEWCDVCGFDYTACTGTDTAVPYIDDGKENGLIIEEGETLTITADTMIYNVGGDIVVNGGSIYITDAISEPIASFVSYNYVINSGTVIGTGYCSHFDCPTYIGGSKVSINGGYINIPEIYAAEVITINGDALVIVDQFDIGTEENASPEHIKGVVFVAGVGTVKGDVTLPENLTVKCGESINFVDGASITNLERLTVEEGATVLIDGNVHTHNTYGTLTYEKLDDTVHTVLTVCEGCPVGYIGETTDNHSTTAENDKAATCKAKAYCSVCESEYGELADHTAEPAYTVNEFDSTQHDAYYSCCGATVTEDHTGGNPTCTTPDVCTTCGENYLNPDNHEYEANNGICCGTHQPATLTDGVYQISNAGQLMWFAELVNGGNKTANAVLTDDIDMTGIDWTPICSTGLYYNTTTYTDKGYEGTFDGGGYTISNLKITGTDGVKASYGLFGTLSGTVKNLGMRGMTFSYADTYDTNTTDARAGAIAGQMLDGSLISDCFVVDSSLTPNNYIVGGIAGCNYAGTIQNCYTKNVTISAHDRCGNLVSDTRGDISTTDRPGTVKNCYTDAGRVVGTNTSGSEYITGCVANILDRIFSSGEITYKLNADRTETVWYQKDGMPAFSGSIVYENTCEGDIFYATTDTDHENHDLGDDFRCSVCGNYDAPEQDANGVYQIATPSNLFWFAEEVNKGNTNINAVLTNDIDLISVQWMPIGNEANPFKGVFDGQNYKIKNLYIHATEGGNYGVFGYLVDGTVKNFSVSGNAVIELSAQEAVYYGVIGAAAARNADTYVTNVHSTVTMEIKDSFNKNSIAGIVGYAEGKSSQPWYIVYIDRCSFGGSMNFGTAYVDVGGGIAGYVNYNGAVYITNCLYDGTITSEYEGAQAVGGIAGYNRGQNMRIQNCLSVGTIELKNTSYAGAIAGRYLVIGTSVFTGSKVTNNYYSGSLPAFSNTTDASIDNYNIDIVDFTEYTGNEAVSVTDTQLKSGEVTWLLNRSTSEGDLVWYQTIGAHDYPVFEGATVNLNGTTYENTGNYIYVEITWTGMEFTYISGDWNPETHQYDEGYWWRPVVNNGEVHVTNKGSAVYVSFGYTSLMDGVSGYFDGDHFLEKDESCYSCLTLEGKPTGGSFTDQQIGYVTVTISQAPPASFTRWWEVGDTVDHIGKNGKVYSCYIADIRDGKYVLLTKEPEIFTTTDAEQLEALKETQLEAVGATRYPAFDSSKAEYAIYESYALESLSASNNYEQYISLAVNSEGKDIWLWEDNTYLVVIEDDLSTYYENYDIKACFYYIFEVPAS